MSLCHASVSGSVNRVWSWHVWVCLFQYHPLNMQNLFFTEESCVSDD